MDKERRHFLRFPLFFPIEFIREQQKGDMGIVGNFSRFGFHVVCDAFAPEPETTISFKIKTPYNEGFVNASGEVVWKKFIEGKWEAGIRIEKFPPEHKAEILEYGFNQWKDKTFCPEHS